MLEVVGLWLHHKVVGLLSRVCHVVVPGLKPVAVWVDLLLWCVVLQPMVLKLFVVFAQHRLMLLLSNCPNPAAVVLGLVRGLLAMIGSKPAAGAGLLTMIGLKTPAGAGGWLPGPVAVEADANLGSKPSDHRSSHSRGCSDPWLCKHCHRCNRNNF